MVERPVANLVGRDFFAAAPFFICIWVARRKLTVRGVGEPQWDDAVAMGLGCFKDRVGEGLLEFVVLRAARNKSKIARVDAFTLMRVG